MTELVKLLDPSELDAIRGPHGRMSIDVSAADLGEAVLVVVPRRLVCARCDGGGCDDCGRSGALRIEGDDEARTTHVVVPKDAGERLLVRLPRPLGDDSLALLTIEVRVAAAPAPIVRVGWLIQLWRKILAIFGAN